MKQHFPFLLIVMLAATVGWQSCINPDEYPVEPQIMNADVSDTLIQQGVDSLVVSFEFQDGDGDLGTPKGDSSGSNIYLIDRRTDYTYTYQMPVVSSREQSVDGTAWITIEPFNINCRPFNDGRDTVSYAIYVVDQKDHHSNTIQTPDVIIQCE